MARRLDLTGKRFSKLTAIQMLDVRGSLGEVRWECLCDCGKTTTVTTAHLRSGHTKSCGCFHISRVTKHGKARTNLYRAWQGMLQRCLSTNNKEYERYGGRGIAVCQRWLDSFESFYEDMGERPEGMTLDRIDHHGEYSPENCRLSTATEQSYNQRLGSKNTSGKSGVTYDYKVEKWHARISKDNKQYNLGFYTTFEEAVAAREKAELELYGYNKQ